MNELKGVLKDSGALAPVRERVEILVNYFEAIVGKTPEEIFISEYMSKTKEGEERVFEGLWYFLDDSIYESKNFLHTVTLDKIRFSTFLYWEVSSRNYDEFENAKEDSHLKVHCGGNSFGSTLQASGVNCDRLRDIFLNRIKPALET